MWKVVQGRPRPGCDEWPRVVVLQPDETDLLIISPGFLVCRYCITTNQLNISGEKLSSLPLHCHRGSRVHQQLIT